jgi:hypothetical protein
MRYVSHGALHTATAPNSPFMTRPGNPTPRLDWPGPTTFLTHFYYLRVRSFHNRAGEPILS